MRKLDLTNKKFGRLTVIKIDHIDKGCYWLCKCKCGKNTIVYIGDLRSGHTKSCGCLHKEKIKKGLCNYKHGMEGTRFYLTWSKILRRIRNKNCKEYKYYGGRGITICKEWLNFINFRDDMYENYLKHYENFGIKQTTIGRIDNEKGYYKENCRWETLKEQANNKRSNIRLKIGNDIMTLKQFCDKNDFSYQKLWYHYKNGVLIYYLKELSFFNISIINKKL